jgi:hypothetical protein
MIWQNADGDGGGQRKSDAVSKKMADKLGFKSEFMAGDWRKPADPAAIAC